MQMVAQEFSKLCEPKINKFKGGYSATANVIIQSWIKDTMVHVEDQNLSQRETIHLVKDFMAKHAQNKVEFYMGIIMEDEQVFEVLVQHLKCNF